MRKRRIPDSVRVAVAERYGAVRGAEIFVPCHYCRHLGRIYWYAESERMGASRVVFGHELDHVRPEYHGGDCMPDNLVLACRRCNRSKGTNVAPKQWTIDGLAMNVSGSPPGRQ